MNTSFRMLLTFFLSTLFVSGGDSDADYEAAVSLIKAKNYTAAETLLNAAISKRPDSPEVHYALGFAVERQNRKSEAVASYLKTVETVLAGPGGRGWDEARKVDDEWQWVTGERFSFSKWESEEIHHKGNKATTVAIEVRPERNRDGFARWYPEGDVTDCICEWE